MIIVTNNIRGEAGLSSGLCLAPVPRPPARPPVGGLGMALFVWMGARFWGGGRRGGSPSSFPSFLLPRCPSRHPPRCHPSFAPLSSLPSFSSSYLLFAHPRFLLGRLVSCQILHPSALSPTSLPSSSPCCLPSFPLLPLPYPSIVQMIVCTNIEWPLT